MIDGLNEQEVYKKAEASLEKGEYPFADVILDIYRIRNPGKEETKEEIELRERIYEQYLERIKEELIRYFEKESYKNVKAIIEYVKPYAEKAKRDLQEDINRIIAEKLMEYTTLGRYEKVEELKEKVKIFFS